MNSNFLNLYEKETNYIANIKTLIHYFDELRAQPDFSFLMNYPFEEYYNALQSILGVENGLKEGLDDINGTFPKVSGVGNTILKYVCYFMKNNLKTS